MPNLTPDQAHTLVRDTINTGLRHAGYQRTVDLRNDYLTILTGKGFERFLKRFTLRSNEEEFALQAQLTYQNLSSTSSPLAKKFGQISRIQDIIKGLSFEGTSERDQRDLQDVLNNFGGEGTAMRGSLDDYLSLSYDNTAIYDPNAFVLLDFLPFAADLGERARPYGVLFSCENVLNFRYTRGELDYLLVWLKIPYTDREGNKKIATDYLLYVGPFVLRYVEQAEGRQDMPDTADTWENDAKMTTYRMVLLSPAIPMVPAVRIGDMPDPETGNLTCVSRLFHSALDLFVELINLKSKSDNIENLHAYPRRYELSPACPGELDPTSGMSMGCNEGINATTQQPCRRCAGSGFLIHRSEQDVIRRELPDNPTNDDIIDLSKLSYTEKPDLDTVKAFKEFIAEKVVDIYKSIFSVDQQVQVQPAKTATEYVVSREDQNNTLLPWADYKSIVYKSLVRFTAAIMNISGEVTALYEFPRDLKLTSMQALYTDLKLARDAKVGKAEAEQIQDDINRKRYESDPAALERYFIKKQHLPYVSMDLDEFEYAYAQNLIPPAMAVLYFNSDIVFGELELETPNFYNMPYKERDTLVSAKVTALQAKLPQPRSLSITRGGQQQEEQVA